MKMSIKEAVNYCRAHKRTAIHTPTRELYNKLMEYLEADGYCWSDGSSLLDSIYDDCKDNTCIIIYAYYNHISFFDMPAYAEFNFNIIELEE